MDIRLFNTLTRSKELFKPIRAGKVSMYHCGPTVYDYAHIGNLRSYVFADTLRRMFEANGYSVNQVINITDVGHLSSDADSGDDKMTKALKRENKPFTLEAMREVADFYTTAFIEDLVALGIKLPSALPKASDHIRENIEIISALESKGFIYKTSDGVYFDTSKYPDYGKLGNRQKAETAGEARIAENTEKKNQRDFSLWKFNDKLGWETPWGKGFPGWHIECSAMARKYLGQPFDIHTGGIDHISIHHNNEIAQSECAFGAPLAHIWMHNEFLTIAGGKMAKSEGNIMTLRSLKERGFSAHAYRYTLLTGHYRSPLAYSLEAVEASQNALKGLVAKLHSWPEGGTADKNMLAAFLEAISDDLDTPKALSLLWEVLKSSTLTEADRRATILAFDSVLGLSLEKEIQTLAHKLADIPPAVLALADERRVARAKKDWKRSDELREQLRRAGFDARDNGDSQEIVIL